MKILKDPDLPPTLLHYTDGEALIKILSGKIGNKLSFRGSRVDRFWGKDNSTVHSQGSQHEACDSEEFAGFVRILRLQDDITRYNYEKALSDSKSTGHLKCARKYGSSYTPYILCFAKGDKASQALFERFKRSGSTSGAASIQLALILDSNLIYDMKNILITNDDAVSQDTECDRLEIFPIEYVNNSISNQEEPDKDDAQEKLRDFSEKYTSIFEQTDPDMTEETAADNDIDSCFYLKREQYESEKEIRIIYREKKDFKFNIEDGAYVSDCNDCDVFRYLHFPLMALKEIVFAEGVTISHIAELAKNIYESAENGGNNKNDFLKNLLRNVIFKTYDNKKVPPEKLKKIYYNIIRQN